MAVGFSGTDPHIDLYPCSNVVLRISKMGFVMQMLIKVFRDENGFGMVVTKKGFLVGSKRV